MRPLDRRRWYLMMVHQRVLSASLGVFRLARSPRNLVLLVFQEKGPYLRGSRARSSAVEHLTFNQVVVGSIPTGLTRLISKRNSGLCGSDFRPAMACPRGQRRGQGALRGLMTRPQRGDLAHALVAQHCRAVHVLGRVVAVVFRTYRRFTNHFTNQYGTAKPSMPIAVPTAFHCGALRPKKT
jgi:hypothetical protein